MTLTVSLPEPLQTFIEEQMARGEYASPGDYIKELVRQAQEREANRQSDQERLEALMLEGLYSGPFIEVTPEYWQQKLANLTVPRAAERARE